MTLPENMVMVDVDLLARDSIVSFAFDPSRHRLKKIVAIYQLVRRKEFFSWRFKSCSRGVASLN